MTLILTEQTCNSIEVWQRALERVYDAAFFVSDVIVKALAFFNGDGDIPEIKEEDLPFGVVNREVDCTREAVLMVKRFIKRHYETYLFSPTEEQVVKFALERLEMCELEAAYQFRIERRIRRNAAERNIVLDDDEVERLVFETMGRKSDDALSMEFRCVPTMNCAGKGDDDIIYIPEQLCYLFPDFDVSLTRFFLYVCKLLNPFLCRGDYRDYVDSDGSMRLFVPYSIFPSGSYFNYVSSLRAARGKEFCFDLTGGESFVLLRDFEKTDSGMYAFIDSSFLELFFRYPSLFLTCRWSEVKDLRLSIYVFLLVFFSNVEHGFSLSVDAFKLMLRANRHVYSYPSHFIFSRVRRFKEALDKCSSVSFDFSYAKGIFNLWPVRKNEV